jgi:hypothetical protein
VKKLLPTPPHIEGPVWQRYDDDTWHLPEKTLGWGLFDWLATYVRSPDGDGPFLPTLEQARFLLWFYAVDDTGRYLYRTATYRRLKGAGKDPLAAAMALAELCGPVAFDHFNTHGDPVGKTRFAAWVQLAAVNYEQTKNTRALFPALITDRLKKDYQVEVNKTLLYTAAGGRLESITSSPYAAEGNRPTFAVANESQYWFETNNGHELFEVVKGNLTKTRGRMLSICNAHVPGEDSVAERDYEAWQGIKAGQVVDTGVLYDSISAPAGTPISEIPSKDIDPEGYAQGLKLLREGLEVARGDSTWLDLDTIISSILDIRTPITESRRKFLNQVTASEDSFIAPDEWDACAVTSEALKLKDGDRVALGFDGSKSGDWTALVACRIDDGLLSVIKAWNPEQYGGEVPTDDVDYAVRAAFDRYDVVAMRADVRMFESYVDAWTRDFQRGLKVHAMPGKPLAFDMRGSGVKKFSYDAEAFLEAVLEQQIVHDADVTLRRHMLNCKRYGTSWGTMSVRKESKDSSRKIDAAVCAILAFGGRRQFLTSKRGSRTGKVTIVA